VLLVLDRNNLVPESIRFGHKRADSISFSAEPCQFDRIEHYKGVKPVCVFCKSQLPNALDMSHNARY